MERDEVALSWLKVVIRFDHHDPTIGVDLQSTEKFDVVIPDQGIGSWFGFRDAVVLPAYREEGYYALRIIKPLRFVVCPSDHLSFTRVHFEGNKDGKDCRLILSNTDPTKQYERYVWWCIIPRDSLKVSIHDAILGTTTAHDFQTDKVLFFSFMDSRGNPGSVVLSQERNSVKSTGWSFCLTLPRV
ncbi:MAG: hypothetical protein QXT16_04510 [Candidatus Caldarchaeum sp.]